MGGSAIVVGAGVGAYRNREAIYGMGRSVRTSTQRFINQNNAKKFDGEAMGRLLDEFDGYELTPPASQSTTNQMVRNRLTSTARGDDAMSAPESAIKRRSFNPARDVEDMLKRSRYAKQQALVKKQTNIAEIELENQPLIPRSTSTTYSANTSADANESSELLRGRTQLLQNRGSDSVPELETKATGVAEDQGMFGGETIDSIEVIKQKTQLAERIADEQAEKEAANDYRGYADEGPVEETKGGEDGYGYGDAGEGRGTGDGRDTRIAGREETEVGLKGGGEEGAAEGGAETADLSAAQAAAEGLSPEAAAGLETIGVEGEVASTSLIGEIAGAGAGGTEAATVAATVTMEAILAGEVATQAAAVYVMGGLVGGVVGAAVAYAVTEATLAIYDELNTTNKEYSQQRNDDMGSHEMDEREVKYKLQELGAIEDYYEKKVNQGYSVSNKDPKAMAQHELDIATYNSIKKNIDSLNESFRNDIPVYAIVEDGFEIDKLSSSERKEYDSLKKRVDDKQKDVNYQGAAAKEKNQRKLDKRTKLLEAFINEHSYESVATGFVNKPSDQEMKILLDAYDENGMDAFKNLSQEQLAVLGITKAVIERDQEDLVDSKIIEPVEVSSEEAAAYWKEEQIRWAAEDAAKQAEENDTSGSASAESMAKRAYYSEHAQEIEATENEDQQTAETSHQDDARGLSENVEQTKIIYFLCNI